MKTYCNPLPLPDYPRGRFSGDKQDNGWRCEERLDFRELADPSVLYWEGKWYLYPSGRMAYVTEDFVTWRWQRIEPEDTGYAPTVVRHRDHFLLTACGAPIFRAPHPLGPFEEIGRLACPDGSAPPSGWLDPMLFSDDDGRLYAYWGIGAPGIYGAELDPENPTRMLTAPRILFAFDPAHAWERYGDNNEDASKSFIEGPWMLKHAGRYFLTYAGPGTEWRTYAMGAYVGDSPLGPFRYQSRNPILSGRHGLVNGPGHGCLVKGPSDTLWAFYTSTCCYYHIFERRLGMDPAGIDADGNLFVAGSTDTPQFAPGHTPRPELGNSPGWSALTEHKPVRASSHTPGRNPAYAVDPSMRTWWQPQPDDASPWIEINLQGPYTLRALRLVWSEHSLDYDAGITPVPIGWRLLAADPDGNWQPVLDCSENATDYLIDYRELPPFTTKCVRLEITRPPTRYALGLTAFTVFGGCIGV